MRFTKRMRVVAAAAVLAVGVVVPSAVASAEEDEGPGAGGLICIDLEDVRMPFGFPFRGERPFGFFEEFEGRFPFREFLGELEGFMEEAPIDELLEGLAEEFEGERPFGFFEEFEGRFPFREFLGELEGFMEEAPIDELLESLAEEFEGERPFGFLEEFEGRFPFREFLGELEGPMRGFRDGRICVPSPKMRAEALGERAADLLEAMEAAGLDVRTETIEIRVPVWDEDDPAVREFLRDYLFGGFGGEFEEGGPWFDTDELPWDLEDLLSDGELPELPFGYDDLIREGRVAGGASG